MQYAGADLEPCRWSVHASDQYILLAKPIAEVWSKIDFAQAQDSSNGNLYFEKKMIKSWDCERPPRPQVGTKSFSTYIQTEIIYFGHQMILNQDS